MRRHRAPKLTGRTRLRKPPNERLTSDLPSREREGSKVGNGTASSDSEEPTPSPSREREGSKLERPSREREGSKLERSSRKREGSKLERPSRDREGSSPERTCILSRRQDGRDRLIRLALSPEGEVLPDIRARAPGRGAWIGVGRAALATAQSKGKLKGALARAFKGAALSIPDDLGARIEEGLRRALLDRLGLEARAGTLLTGAEKIDTAARRGEVHLLLHAADAGADGNRSLDQAWRVGGGEAAGLIIPAGRTTLAMALGRQNVVHIALIDRGAAARVRHALDRWRAFIEPDDGLGASAAAHGMEHGRPDASAEFCEG